jgi:HD-like signal output (HDOD) protein
MHATEEVRSFLHRLQRNPPKLPFEPTLMPTLCAMTRDDTTASTGALAALIERSQKLAARALARANSAVYGLKFKVSTLQQAIRILGIRELRLLVIQEGMAMLFSEIKLPKAFDINKLWGHQLKVAAIAKSLAAMLGGPSGICGPSAKEEDRLNMAPDEAYIAGLLHDIGKVFFAASLPDLWEVVEKAWKKDEQRYFEAENEYWSIDHALIGAEVLHSWQLPLLLTEPINWHHTPELATTDKMATRILAAANCIEHDDFTGENGLCEEAASLLPEGIDTAALTQILASANAASLIAL